MPEAGVPTKHDRHERTEVNGIRVLPVPLTADDLVADDAEPGTEA